MNICKQIIEQIDELFECSSFGEYIRIETPFIYPDGDIIDLFYRETSRNRSRLRPYKIITDLGGASDWLGLQSISKSRTDEVEAGSVLSGQSTFDKQEEQIEYICETYRIEFRKGEFFIDLDKGNETRSLAEAVFDLGQAIIRISSL